MAFNGVASSHQQFTMLVNADGNFQLKSADGPCVDGSAGGTIGDADCSNAGTWNLQPASDGSQYYLLRHVGNDNQCIVPAYSGQLELGTCDPTNDQQLYSITTSNGASLPAPSNSDAIGLGSNQITVCNHGAYVAYADITTNVEEDPSSTTTTAANAGNSNIDAGQCWTDTIPAGKVTSTVTLQRAGVEGAPDGTGNIAVWIVGGVHTDATYDLYGTTCGTSSTFSQASDSQSYSLQASGQVNCNAGSDTVFDDVGAGAQGAWDLVNKILYWVLQASWVK